MICFFWTISIIKLVKTYKQFRGLTVFLQRVLEFEWLVYFHSCLFTDGIECQQTSVRISEKISTLPLCISNGNGPRLLRLSLLFFETNFSEALSDVLRQNLMQLCMYLLPAFITTPQRTRCYLFIYFLICLRVSPNFGIWCACRNHRSNRYTYVK